MIAPSIARGSVESDTFARVVIAIGALLVFLSAALRTWGAAYLRTAIVHDTAQHSDALVADGPFRYTRNPLYLASLPIAAGIGVLASVSGFIFLVLANWIFVYRLSLGEEESLRQSQGESYRAYCELVPRFWPSFRPRVPPGNLRPQWGQALGGESFVWLFGLAELLVAITLRAVAALIAFPLTFWLPTGFKSADVKLAISRVANRTDLPNLVRKPGSQESNDVRARFRPLCAE